MYGAGAFLALAWMAASWLLPCMSSKAMTFISIAFKTKKSITFLCF